MSYHVRTGTPSGSSATSARSSRERLLGRGRQAATRSRPAPRGRSTARAGPSRSCSWASSAKPRRYAVMPAATWPEHARLVLGLQRLGERPRPVRVAGGEQRPQLAHERVVERPAALRAPAAGSRAARARIRAARARAPARAVRSRAGAARPPRGGRGRATGSARGGSGGASRRALPGIGGRIKMLCGRAGRRGGERVQPPAGAAREDSPRAYEDARLRLPRLGGRRLRLEHGVQLHPAGVVEALGERRLGLGAQVEVRELVDPRLDVAAADQQRPPALSGRARPDRPSSSRRTRRAAPAAVRAPAARASGRVRNHLSIARHVDRVVDPVLALDGHPPAAADLHRVVLRARGRTTARRASRAARAAAARGAGRAPRSARARTGRGAWPPAGRSRGRSGRRARRRGRTSARSGSCSSSTLPPGWRTIPMNAASGNSRAMPSTCQVCSGVLSPQRCLPWLCT